MQNIQDHIHIKRLHELGHFYHPEHKNGWNVTKEDLLKLTLKDQVVKDALASFQDMMIYDFERLSFKHHHHRGMISGEMCPATLELFDVQRCGHPDYKLPEGNTAIGTGSWPMPCQKAGIKVHINKKNMPSVLINRWPEIQRLAFAAYHKIGANVVETNNEAEALIRVWWEFLAGSTIGIAKFNSQRCSGWIFCKLDIGYTDLMFELFTHELGHNMNLQHTRGGIMNPSIIAVNPKEWNKNDPSYSTLQRYFGGEPVVPEPKPVSISAKNIPNGVDAIDIDFSNAELLTKFNNKVLDTYILVSNKLI